MANYVFSTITAEQAAAFNATTDVLLVDAGTAPDVVATGGSSSAGLTVAGKTVTLPVALAALTTSVVTFIDGSTLIVGDNNSNTIADPLANSVTGTAAEKNQIWGLAGNDTLTGNSVADIIYGNQGSDNLTGAAGNDSLYGGQDNDILTGGADNDLVYGNLGADSIDADAGSDTIYGGQGNDTVTATGGGNNLVHGNLGDDSVTGGAGNDTIWGDDGADRLAGGAGSNIIYGNVGADTITATGADTVYGGKDNDSITGSGSGSVVYGNLGGDELIVGANNIDITVYGGQGADTITAGNVFGAVGDEVRLYGNDGDDVFVLSSATGLLAGDTIDGGAGTDTISIGANADLSGGTLTGIEGVAFTATSALTLTAAQINNLTSIDASGASAGATIVLQMTTDGGAIDLSSKTVAGLDRIAGDTGADVIVGTANADSIEGAAGNDQLNGGGGVDTIVGGTGDDTLAGGAGADTFQFGTDGSVAGTDLDVISDFAKNSDVLDFGAAAVLLAAETNGTTATTDVDTSAGGKVSFAAADDTYAEKVAAIQADTELDAIASVAFFEDGSDTYVYYAGAATGDADDQIIKLAGVTGLTTITVTATNDITIA